MKDNRLTLIPGRTLKQGTGMNIGKKSDEYQKAVTTIEMNREDMDQLGVEDGDTVRIRASGGEAVVHIACRDRSRASLESVAFGLASEGLTNVLALSGDYPKEGYKGRSRGVFDIDSVGLTSLLRDAGERGPSFTIGCAINPFKAIEAALVPQSLKLAMKVRAGADFAVTQIGYDARSWSELLGPSWPASGTGARGRPRWP